MWVAFWRVAAATCMAVAAVLWFIAAFSGPWWSGIAGGLMGTAAYACVTVGRSRSQSSGETRGSRWANGWTIGHGA
jgi:hypothetical protein